ncbi:MAG: hypothetical protein HFI19_16805 [Lachnospiraceae bacterium]|jgi:hypothetical protein|nr:hypothetical protein [Lachnospiraceae bacterium]
MRKAWDVTVNGVVHKVEYKTTFGVKILVNGNAYKTRSQNWFINMIDYPITIDGAEIRVVAIGNKVDLAVNGRYLGSGEEYVPLNKMPVVANVFVGISCIGGVLFAGWLGLLIGILFSFLYIKLGLRGKTGPLIAAFAACVVILAALTYGMGQLWQALEYTYY